MPSSTLAIPFNTHHPRRYKCRVYRINKRKKASEAHQKYVIY